MRGHKVNVLIADEQLLIHPRRHWHLSIRLQLPLGSSRAFGDARARAASIISRACCYWRPRTWDHLCCPSSLILLPCAQTLCPYQAWPCDLAMVWPPLPCSPSLKLCAGDCEDEGGLRRPKSQRGKSSYAAVSVQVPLQQTLPPQQADPPIFGLPHAVRTAACASPLRAWPSAADCWASHPSVFPPLPHISSPSPSREPRLRSLFAIERFHLPPGLRLGMSAGAAAPRAKEGRDEPRQQSPHLRRVGARRVADERNCSPTLQTPSFDWPAMSGMRGAPRSGREAYKYLPRKGETTDR